MPTEERTAEVTTLESNLPPEIAEAFREYALRLANAFKSPEVVLRKLAEWLQENHDFTDMGYWLVMTGSDPDFDEGIRVSIYKRPKWRDLSLGLLIGRSTSGFDLQTPLYTHGDDSNRTILSVGVGVVSPHEDFLRKWYPALTCSIRFTFGG